MFCLSILVLNIYISVLAEEISENIPTGPAVFHGGMEVFYQEGGDSSNQLSQFITQLKLLSEINAQKVVLEFFMYLMTEKRTEDAKMQLELLPKRSKEVSSHDKVINKTLIKAYEGLIYYVEYLEAKHRRGRLLNQSAGDPFMESSVSGPGDAETQIMTSAANKAINCFSKIEGESGVWDIFVTKHVELLEFLELLETAQLVLQRNAEKNPENPNALKLLFNYYCRHDCDVDLCKEVLQQVCAQVPSDESALRLHDILHDEGSDMKERLTLLFDLLDYATWQNDVRPWSRLANELCTINEQSGTVIDSGQVTDLWRIRSSWWPDYQFDAFTQQPGELSRAVLLQPALYQHKVAVSKFLLGVDNSYAVEIESILKTNT